MKKLFFVIIILFVFFEHISAQNVPGVPNGSIAKDTRDDFDNGIRIRSIELERIKNEAYRTKIDQKNAANRKLNYLQIKEDFELIQNLQNQIIKTYITGKDINYGRISEFAAKLNECARRLDKNLLLAKENTFNKSKKKNYDTADVKDLIVILDQLVGSFVTNSLFQNLNIIESKKAEKAESDLQDIIRLSDFLTKKTAELM